MQSAQKKQYPIFFSVIPFDNKRHLLKCNRAKALFFNEIEGKVLAGAN
jgi:hypothetical protein